MQEVRFGEYNKTCQVSWSLNLKNIRSLRNVLTCQGKIFKIHQEILKSFIKNGEGL